MVDKNSKLAPKNPMRDITARPKLSAIRNDDLTKAITSKLLDAPLTRPLNRRGNYQTPQPSGELVWNVTEKTSNNIQDNRNMLQLLPDLELAKQILISSILSPNDMLSSELTFYAEADLLAELQTPLLGIVEDYFKRVYKIEPLLTTILEDVLFKTGSYPMAVIPESAIDDAINSPERIGVAALESIRSELEQAGQIRPCGILGPTQKETKHGYVDVVSTGIESLRSDPRTTQGINPHVAHPDFHLRVTDNPNIIKQPLLLEKIRTDKIASLLNTRRFSFEAKQDKDKTNTQTDAQFRASMFKTRQYVSTPVLGLKTQGQVEKPTVGHPLVLTLPAESIIPVHTPSNPDEHIGYFVLLDQTGNPISKAILSDYYTDLASNISQNKDLTSQMLNITRRSIEGRKMTLGDLNNVELATNIYMEIVEQDLMQRLKNGVYGENVQIARPQEVYRIMLARACKGMYTQLLYVPSQLMTYIAFDYNQYGVGKSLLEDSKIIGSLRAMIMFANTMAAIKNSVGHVELNIELDPNDPDPGQTIEQLMHEYVKTRQAAYPIGASNPLDIVNYLQAAGVEVTTQGHPGWPTTKMAVNDKTTNRATVNPELEDNLRKRHLMSIGVAPEHVDLSMGADFATSVMQSNLLLAKRAMMLGQKLTAFITDHIQKYSLNSQILMDQMRAVIEEKPELLKKLDPDNKYGVDGLVAYFINSLRTSLPEPNMKGIEMQLQGFEEYTKALDTVIPAFVSEEIFDSNIMGEMGNSIRTTIAVIKSHYQRKWLQENNVLPELFDMLVVTDEHDIAFDLLNVHEEHMKSINRSLMGFMKKVLKAKEKNDKTIQDLGGVEQGSGGGSSGGGSEEGGEGGEGGEGADDMSFDFGEPPGGEGDEGSLGGEAEGGEGKGEPEGGEAEAEAGGEAKPGADEAGAAEGGAEEKK